MDDNARVQTRKSRIDSASTSKFTAKKYTAVSFKATCILHEDMMSEGVLFISDGAQNIQERLSMWALDTLYEVLKRREDEKPKELDSEKT